MSESHTAALDQNAIRARFDRCAASFEQASFVHEQAADALIDRMRLLQLTPEWIIDAGSGTGRMQRKLRKQFRQARIVSLDFSKNMLRRIKAPLGLPGRRLCIRADFGQLPFATGSADLISASLVLPWIGAPDQALREAQRVLKRNRPLFFTSIGPDSFRELRSAWASIGDVNSVPPFIDMHDLGDAMIRAGFADPVLDVDRLTIRYPSFERLWSELRSSGSGNALASRRRGLTGRDRFLRLQQAFRELYPGSSIELTLELVYGHGWASGKIGALSDPGEYRIDIRDVRHRS